MRFKIHFNEELKKIEVNCLNDNSDSIFRPSVFTDGHIHYPIPNDLKKNIKKILEDLIPQSSTNEFINIDKQIKELTDYRREMMNKLRMELNPLIFNKCKEFRLENAEYFI